MTSLVFWFFGMMPFVTMLGPQRSAYGGGAYVGIGGFIVLIAAALRFGALLLSPPPRLMIAGIVVELVVAGVVPIVARSVYGLPSGTLEWVLAGCWALASLGPLLIWRTRRQVGSRGPTKASIRDT